MKISSNGQAHWKYDSSIAFDKVVKQSIGAVVDAGKRQLIAQTFAKALEHIKRDPLAAGGPRFRYHKLDLLNYVYLTEYFVLHYAIDETRHLIYLRKFVMFD